MGKTRQAANLVSDNSIYVDLDNGRIGIKSTSPTADLDIVGDLNVSGTITGTFGGSIASADSATTATTATYATTAGIATYATTAGIATYATTAGIATNAQGLTGTPTISVAGENNTGVSTLTDLRLASIADKISIQSGAAVTLSYGSGEGNVVYMTSASGPITLNVTDIPTSSDFDSKALSFSIFVNQGTTAYACTSVTLNGVSFGADASAGLATHIAYASGTVATGNTSCVDVFNFTGINTTGSASSTANYKLLGNVNGDYRLY